jgi:hypothetical protein
MTNEQSGRAKGRVTFIAAAAVVALIVVLAIVVGIIFAVRGSDNRAPVAATTPTATSTSGSALTTESACGGSVPYEKSGTLTSAPETKWKAWGPTQLATSKEAGPTRSQNGFESCFARTPEGALYAAFDVAQYCSDSTVGPAAAEYFVADGPGKAAAISLSKSSGPCTPSAPLIQGFRVTSYSGSAATIYFAASTTTGQLGAVGLQLRWENGDWRAVASADGGSTVASTPLSSTAGYVTWGPSNAQ